MKVELIFLIMRIISFINAVVFSSASCQNSSLKWHEFKTNTTTYTSIDQSQMWSLKPRSKTVRGGRQRVDLKRTLPQFVFFKSRATLLKICVNNCYTLRTCLWSKTCSKCYWVYVLCLVVVSGVTFEESIKS